MEHWSLNLGLTSPIVAAALASAEPPGGARSQSSVLDSNLETNELFTAAWNRKLTLLDRWTRMERGFAQASPPSADAAVADRGAARAAWLAAAACPGRPCGRWHKREKRRP